MNANYTGKCPIWQTPANCEYADNWMLWVNSPRAGGEFYIHQDIEKDIEGRYNDCVKARLTSWLIEQRLLGVKCPKITGTEIKKVLERRALSELKRADRLLKHFQKRTRYPGDSFEYHTRKGSDPDPFWQIMAWSESTKREEAQFFVDYLQKKDWTEKATKGPHPTLRLTIAGYVHLAELEKTNIDSSQAFVVMWFHGSTDPVWEDGIEPAIKNTGYKPKRIDKKEHINKIDDEIIAEICRSRFIVADFTHGRGGVRGSVYYEAGFAHGLNIPVIFTCRKNALERIHFDTRQYNYITWRNPDELRQRLEDRIGAVIGYGPVRYESETS
ncbi:MAG: hypothetical protein OXK19_04665 [Candidatus Dadabacteria bacterium]|nr:hypothetical protein [Candidatus Dadabacteria bacterium]